MLQKVIKTGNSLALTVPSDFAKALGIKAGQEVKTQFNISSGILKYSFPGASQLPLL